MENEIQDANTEEAQTSAEPSTATQEQQTSVSEDANTQSGKSAETKYEEAVKALKQEREKAKKTKAERDELEKRITALESEDPEEKGTAREYTVSDARAEIVYAMQKDPFVKENLDLIEGAMEDKGMTLDQAVTDVKASIFDRIQRSTDEKEETNLPKQVKPSASPDTQTKPQASGNYLKDALEGKIDVNPQQLEAVRRTMGG